ncbi:hypothetical protein [Candidatus Manganitrophus noduliformans]|uniref:hypothetical protein n=1 Tax=Candidatus Manganitrophus noduliformans TaxID=2606439 RepID=UPI001439AB98|nr:hypothetical protein [Candidatus Manganitrophus noduliformans]
MATVTEYDLQQWEKEWRGSPTLREEFPKLSTYQAFKKAEANGQVRILKSKQD